MTTHRLYRFTIAQLDGRPLCTLLVSRDRPNVSPQHPAATADSLSTPPAPAKAGHGTLPASESEPRMTAPERRDHLRLLAPQGVAGRAVDAHRRQLLKVPSLREVSAPSSRRGCPEDGR